MKLKDAKSQFSNCKMYVGTRSEEVQNKLFSLGFKWRDERIDKEQVPINTDKPFLYIINGIITCGESFYYFKLNELKEVYVNTFLDTPITLSYGPFSNRKECWNEMLKHQPFGWLKSKTGDYEALINSVNFTDVNINNYYYTYKQAFDDFTFIDGTLFGIKED